MTKILIDRSTVEQALEALELYVPKEDYENRPVGNVIDALRSALAEPEGGGNLPPPLPGDFDHAIGADRFKVVRGAFWWHVLIGDSPTEHGKFRSRASAEKMAADLLREFRNGAFVQYEAKRAEQAQEPVQQALCEADRIMSHDDEATEWRERWAHLFSCALTNGGYQCSCGANQRNAK